MRFENPIPDPPRCATSVGTTAENVPDLFRKRVEHSASSTAFKAKVDGRWQSTTWKEAEKQASALASWLIERGVERQDKVVIVGNTRPEWCVADIGGHLAGAVTIGAYPTLTDAQLAYVLSHSDAKVAIVAGEAELTKVIAVWDECPALDAVIVWDPAQADRDDVFSWNDVLETAVDTSGIESRIQSISPDECAIIVYTSGTTGPPKGAMLSHDNIMAMVRPGLGIPFSEDEESLCFLPMAHVAERILGFYQRINHGTIATYATSIPAVLDEVKEIRPTLFGSVPRIFEKAHARIHATVDTAPPMRQKIFRWAAAVGRRSVDLWQRGEPMPLGLRIQRRLADRIVFSKLRQAFGGRVRFYVTGAAPIPEEVLRFFWGAGFPVFEAYGMTESTALSHVNLPGKTRLGSVGKAVSFVECKLADDGEVLVRGDTVFMGYYKDEEATKAVIDDDGWLHTGDIGRIDDEGYLFIIDRKKHIIITAGGKNLTPANIENEIKSADSLISQVHAHADGRPYVTALVTMGPMECLDIAAENSIAPSSEIDDVRRAVAENPLARPPRLDELMAEVSGRPDIRKRIARAVADGNRQLGRVEKVKRVYLLDRELSVERDELTPTLKAKRRNIEKTFKEQFDQLYADEEFGIVVPGT